MGWLSWANPVKIVREVARQANPVLNVNRAYRQLEDGGNFLDQAADDIGGFGDDHSRGAYDLFGTKEAKDAALAETEAQRLAEEQRQSRISANYKKIDDTFANFNDAYYSDVAKAYLDYYTPLVQEQYAQAKRAMATNAPNTSSSAYGRSIGNLETDLQREMVNLNDRAQSASLAQRGTVEQNRATLKQSALGGAGLEDIASQASNAAAVASRPPNYSSLGDLFGRYAAMYGNTKLAQSYGYGGASGAGSGSPILFSGSKTVTNVR